MHAPLLGKAAWVWLVFVAVVTTLLTLDLGVLHKRDREIGVSESLFLSAGHIGIALLFGAWAGGRWETAAASNTSLGS